MGKNEVIDKKGNIRDSLWYLEIKQGNRWVSIRPVEKLIVEYDNKIYDPEYHFGRILFKLGYKKRQDKIRIKKIEIDYKNN